MTIISEAVFMNRIYLIKIDEIDFFIHFCNLNK